MRLSVVVPIIFAVFLVLFWGPLGWLFNAVVNALSVALQTAPRAQTPIAQWGDQAAQVFKWAGTVFTTPEGLTALALLTAISIFVYYANRR